MKKIQEVILFQIEQASKVSKQYAQRELDHLGIDITVEQWVLLKIISESTELTQRELAKKSSRDPASITRTLDLLQRKSLVIRNPIPNNRRGYYIELTEEGTAFIERHLDAVLAMRAQSTAGFSEDELTVLSEMLERVKKNMG